MSKRRKAHGRPQESKSRKTAKRLAKKTETLNKIVAKRKFNKNHKIKSKPVAAKPEVKKSDIKSVSTKTSAIK